MSGYFEQSLLSIKKALDLGQVSPSELVAASLSKITATEPMLNACVTVNERALEDAKHLEAVGRTENMPLWGVPITLKDNICTEGLRTTCGSSMLENFIPPYTATLAKKLTDAGAIIVAKNNMDEFAMGGSTETSFSGTASNPWDINKVTGGSSGGSAASVAACQAYGAIGSDSGGSIRQPASFCGCVGLKPTYGRVSRYGVVAYASSFDQAGPFARTTGDCAALLSAIAGYDPLDATSSDIPTLDYLEATKRKDLRGVTLGVVKEFWDGGLSAEVLDACERAKGYAKSLGANIVEVSLPRLRHGIATYYILTCAEASTNMARFDGVRFGFRCESPEDLQDLYVRSRSLAFGDEVKRRILLGTYVLSAGYYDAYYQKAAKIRRLILRDYQAAFTKCDALIAPACPVTAWEKGAFLSDPLSAYKMDELTLGLNLAGLPGLSLPVGLGKDSRLPVGLQVMGKAFDELGILAIAHALETCYPAMSPSLKRVGQ